MVSCVLVGVLLLWTDTPRWLIPSSANGPDTGDSVTCPNEGEELESECQERQTNQEASLSYFPGAEGAPLGDPPLGPEALAQVHGSFAGGS